MYIYKNIYLIGTSHVAKQSVLEVKNSFEINPDIVAVELDENRAYAIKNNLKRKKSFSLIKDIGFFGYLFYLLGQYVQEKYGRILNIQPGTEMLTAIKLAKEKNLPLFFIDRDIKITLTKFSKKIKKIEILKIFFELLLTPFYSIFKKQKIKLDLSKIPDEKLIDFILQETKKSYPSIYKVLIDERDLYMAKKLFILSNKYSDKIIIAVVGAGHVKGILNYLEKLSKSNTDIAY